MKIARLLTTLSLLWVAGMATPKLFAGKVSIEGTIASNKTYLELTVTLSNLPETDFQITSTQLYDRLFIYMEGIDDTAYVKPQNATGEGDYIADYTYTITKEPEATTGTDNTATVIVQVRVNQNSATSGKTIADLLGTDNTLEVNASFDTADGDVEADKSNTPFKLTYEVGIANEAPANFSVSSSHLGLVFNWESKNPITYHEASDRAASGINIILVDSSETTEVTFNAKTFNKDDRTTETVDQSCTLTINLDGEDPTCEISQCTGEFSFLSPDDNQGIPGVTIQTANSPSPAFSITDLKENVPYAAFAQYKPDGLQLSSCIIGIPTRNYSLTELNGADDAIPGDPTCFIATAAYGTPIHQDLDLLRWFRDHHLLTHGLGYIFVKMYYKYSPPIAEWIAEHEPAKAGVRMMLFPIVWSIGTYQESPVGLLLGLAGMLLIFTFGAAGAFFGIRSFKSRIASGV